MKLNSGGRITLSLAWSMAVVALTLAGTGYRLLAHRLQAITAEPIRLELALAEFPLHVNNWQGRDVPIPDNILRAARNDDFLNRLYVNRTTNNWVNLYIAYTARPRTMIGHRPQICYVGGGWVHDRTFPAEVITRTGRKVPCLVHQFHMPAPNYEQRLVLNFYIANGVITTDESLFSGVGWRTPNIAGNPARYVTQVQISSALESSARSAAKDMTDLILRFFPGPEQSDPPGTTGRQLKDVSG